MGPGDPQHEGGCGAEVPLVGAGTRAPPLPLSALPHTNLPLNLPRVQNQPPQNFSVKDQHLLKPPPAMGACELERNVAAPATACSLGWARTCHPSTLLGFGIAWQGARCKVYVGEDTLQWTG